MTETNPHSEPRESFMQRVHGALGRKRTEAPSESAPEVDQSLARLAEDMDELMGLFTERAEAVGLIVHRVQGNDAADTVIETLRSAGAERVALAAGEAGANIELEEALRDAAFTLSEVEAGPGMAPSQYELDAGITDVHAALAETGTLVLCSDAKHPRGLSLAPPTHIALVRCTDILPDMIDYWAQQKGLPNTELPSSQTFVTGPSKTADIEGELITGVHGPGAVHVVLIEDA